VAAQAHQEVDGTTEAALRIGRTLREKWHLDALIDVGGMAAVYAATHRNGMRGAVKILHRHRSLDPDVAARFRREGYIANKVAHPNAVRVLDDDVDDDGSVFLVMELLEGSTLRERAVSSGGKLTPDQVLLAVDPMLDVLAVAHEAAIIHRDVKPDNVFVTTDGQIKILDFGIARLFEPTGSGHTDTIAGVPMGSPAFMSPEQARGRWDLVDVQSDVWSVGATMFTLLSGRDVHVEETLPELLAAIFTRPAPSLATALPDAHPALVDVVDRALQLRLADRWPDARAMQVAVRKAYAEMYGAALPAAAPATRTVADSSPGEVRREESHESHALPSVVTTVIAPEARRRRYLRHAALALTLLLAGGLGTFGVEHERRARGAMRPHAALASLGEEAARPSDAQEPSSIPTAGSSVSLSRSSTPSPVTPAVRLHRRSVYDRRK
jgi:eukaryotic-like serine/threonine-protein kinase